MSYKYPVCEFTEVSVDSLIRNDRKIGETCCISQGTDLEDVDACSDVYLNEEEIDSLITVLTKAKRKMKSLRLNRQSERKKK